MAGNKSAILTFGIEYKINVKRYITHGGDVQTEI